MTPRLRLALAALAVLPAAAALAAEPGARPGKGGCVPVLGFQEVRYVPCPQDFASPLGLCTEGAISLGGVRWATTRFRALAAAPLAGLPEGSVSPGTLSYTGELEVRTAQGTLLLRDAGLSDGAAGTFVEQGQIVFGTGAFAGATGTLFFAGRQSGDTFSATVTGQLCR